jgi:hypothetical protein
MRLAILLPWSLSYVAEAQGSCVQALLASALVTSLVGIWDGSGWAIRGTVLVGTGLSPRGLSPLWPLP